MTVNKVILVGRLGRDPEVRYTNTGLAIANVSLATSTVRKDKNTGERTTETEWHRVVFFERLAEICEQYLKKGSQVYLEGKLKTRKYTGQDGIERYATEVHADTSQMLGSKDEQQSNNTGGFEQANKTAPTAKPAPTATTAAQAKSYAAASGGTVKSVDELEDDIPF